MIITNNKDNNIEIVNKHDLTTLATINNDNDKLWCSLMIGDYIYIGCENNQLCRVNKYSYQSTSIDTNDFIICMIQYDDSTILIGQY